MKHKVTLLQALTGADFTFKHLDGRIIRVKNTPGQIIKHDEIKTIEDCGMPLHKKSFNNGNLFIQFEVVFPETVSESEKKALVEAFGAVPKIDTKDVKETVEMVKHEEWHKNTSA